MAKIAEDLKKELDALLSSEKPVLQSLLQLKYITSLRSRLDIENKAQIEYLRSLTIPKRDLFLQYIVNPESANEWKRQLQTDEERKAAGEMETKRNQEALSAQLLLHQQRMVSEAKANREEQDKAEAEERTRTAAIANLEAERSRLAAEAYQVKMQNWHAARARTGF